MGSFLRESLAVADSGPCWEVGDYILFQSMQPGIALFIAKHPRLVKTANGRFAAAISSYTQQQSGGNLKVTGGSATFAITSAAQFDVRQMQAAMDSWRAAAPPGVRKDVTFMPLNVQKGEATVLINPQSGTPDQSHNDKDVGTPGGTMSFLVELTELGAQEWAQGIKNKTPIPAGVKFQYEYLRNMPTVGSEVILHGSRVFKHLSAALNVTVNGIFYGGSAKIDAAWEDMVKNGAVEVIFHGTLPPELETLRQDLTTTAAKQARELLFDKLFAPKPDIKPAEAGTTSGFFGGANFALKWKQESEAVDFTQTVKFEGLTWLKASMDAPLSALLADLDASYVTEVQTQQSFQTLIHVDKDDLLSSAAVSVNYSEGRMPDVLVANENGLTDQKVVTSLHPQKVKVRYNAKINFAPSKWPIIQTGDAATVADGGNSIFIKPSSWIGRHNIYLLVRDGDRILSPNELSTNDFLILNVSYSGPHLSAPIRDSAHLTGFGMIEFSYPLDPKGRPGKAKFSAFGVIGGKLVRSPEQVIDTDEINLSILVGTDGKIQLVSGNSPLPKSEKLGQRLLAAQARPIITNSQGRRLNSLPAKNGKTKRRQRSIG